MLFQKPLFDEIHLWMDACFRHKATLWDYWLRTHSLPAAAKRAKFDRKCSCHNYRGCKGSQAILLKVHRRGFIYKLRMFKPVQVALWRFRHCIPTQQKQMLRFRAFQLDQPNLPRMNHHLTHLTVNSPGTCNIIYPALIIAT